MTKDELFEQGKALYEQEQYEEALEAFSDAIELDGEDAALWHAAARTCYQLEDYEQAAEAYRQAAELDDGFAAAWNGLGAALLAQGMAQEAMDAYRQAIRRDRGNPAPWTGLGAIYFQGLQQPQEGARYFQRVEHLGKAAAAESCFNVFAQLPAYPFFSYRIIQSYMPPEQYERWEDYLRQTFADAAPLQAYLAWLELQAQQGQLAQDAQWHFGLGLLHLLMGDPAPALEHFNRSQERSPETDLMVAYYQLQACWDFVEPDHPYLKPALEKAETFVLPEQGGGWQFWKKKAEAPTLPPDDILPCYYAGLIFAENDEMDKALQCFERIERDFLPAAYLAMWACEEMVLPKKKKEKALYLLQQEAARPQFCTGLQAAQLSLDPADFPAQFLHTTRYLELAEAIEQLHLFAEFEGNPHEVEIMGTVDNPPFHLLWSLRDEDAARIQEALRQELAQLAREKLAGPAAAAQPLSDALQQLYAAAQQQGAELVLAEAAGSGQYSLEDFSLFLIRLNFEKILTEEQKTTLNYYALLKAHWQPEAPEDSLATLREGIQRLIGDGQASLLGPEGSGSAWTGYMASAEARLAAGRQASALLAWLEEEKPTEVTYAGVKVQISKDKG
jgi:tetratricopeptide (TPR) repeat protein